VFGDHSAAACLPYLAAAMLIAFLLPESNVLVQRFMEAPGPLGEGSRRGAGTLVAAASAFLFCASLLSQLGTIFMSPLIYFQF
jgi:hypothetical protein